MVRIRAYSFTLCLPLTIMSVGMLLPFAADEIAGVGSVSIAVGAFLFAVVLQAIFALAIACPRCGKSPYSFGPFSGPFSFGGKPVPDRLCSNCGYKLAGAREK